MVKNAGSRRSRSWDGDFWNTVTCACLDADDEHESHMGRPQPWKSQGSRLKDSVCDVSPQLAVVSFLTANMEHPAALRVCTLSGVEIARISTAQLERMEGPPVVALKRHLQGICGMSRFRQKLLHNHTILRDDDLHVPLLALEPKDLQLVQLPVVSKKWLAKELVYCVRRGEVERLELLLQEPADPNTRVGLRGWYLLHMVAYMGKVEIAELLLEAGADKERPTDDEDFEYGLKRVTPLMVACRKNRFRVAQLLLRARADVEKVCGYHRISQFATALWLASRMGHQRIVQLLLEAGAKDCHFHPNRGTSLHVAAKYGHHESVRLLLQAGFDLNRGGNFGTPLHEASHKGDEEMIDLLLDAQAEVNQLCRLKKPRLDVFDHKMNDSTPLHVASWKGDADIVKMLLAARADVHRTAWNEDSNRFESDFMTPLQLASVESFGSEDVVETLLEARAEINQPGSLGTALRVSCLASRPWVVEVLLEAAADPNLAERTGEKKRKFGPPNLDGSTETPWQIAVRRRHLEVVGLLEAKGAGKMGAKSKADCWGTLIELFLPVIT